ncbi:MAG: dipeptide epimerase [Hyphomicrobiaceae bacterium]|nr:MAG: dipeptide epimerase [Hyphomicrobiaceae bacterium]
MALSIEASIETWPIAGTFTISRGSKREAAVVVARVSDGAITGRGECVPYGRYGETVESVCAQIASLATVADRSSLLQTMPSGAARNAIDCALWDYEAKSSGTPAAACAGLAPLRPLTTAYTISLDRPEAMAARAADAARTLPLLKLKLGGAGDAERMRAVRAACPGARLIADANESWTPTLLPELMRTAAESRIELIEQPLPEEQDELLAALPRPVPVCADESLHTRADLVRLADRYDAINIKLDKAGGLTEALALLGEARAIGFKIMTGCMVSTSLSMAPALLVAQSADWVDLDGPLLLAKDRRPGLYYEGALVYPPEPELWG